MSFVGIEIPSISITNPFFFTPVSLFESSFHGTTASCGRQRVDDAGWWCGFDLSDGASCGRRGRHKFVDFLRGWSNVGWNESEACRCPHRAIASARATTRGRVKRSVLLLLLLHPRQTIRYGKDDKGFLVRCRESCWTGSCGNDTILVRLVWSSSQEICPSFHHHDLLRYLCASIGLKIQVKDRFS